MDELVAFLRAALDRDEQVAREALHDDAVRPGEWMTEHHGMDSEHPLTCHIAEDRSGQYWSVAHEVYIPNAEHIARWDPARVLAEVQARRAIIEAHPIDTDLSAYAQSCGSGKTYGCVVCHDWDGVTMGEGYCATLLALAQPYAGQPGWQEEWQLSAPA